MKLGQRLTIATDALPQQFVGRGHGISPAADPKSRVFSVEVTIPNPRNQLKSGMIASLSLGGERWRARAAVPSPRWCAILEPATDLPSWSRKVSPRSSPAVRSVELGDAYGNMIAANNGVALGERVVTTGVSLVKDGDRFASFLRHPPYSRS